MSQKIKPIHPGEVLLEEFLIPMGISQYRLANDISVPAKRINEIVLGNRAISVDTALRLSEYFRLSEKFWLNLQMKYNLEVEKDKLKNKITIKKKLLRFASEFFTHYSPAFISTCRGFANCKIAWFAFNISFTNFVFVCFKFPLGFYVIKF